MTTTEKRLDEVALRLTVRERLTLVMRGWLNDEPWDERLVRHLPPGDRSEYDDLANVVETTNMNLIHILAFELEWLRNLEAEVSRFVIVSALLGRCQLLESAVKGQLRLPNLPPSALGFVSDLPHLWGRSLTDVSAPPSDWPAACEVMLADIRLAFDLRCDGLLAVEEVLHSLSDAFTEPMEHKRLLDAFPPYHAKLQQIADAMRPFDGTWEIPAAASEGALTIVHAHVPHDKFPKPPAAEARHLPWNQKEEIETFEAEMAASLRQKRAERESS